MSKQPANARRVAHRGRGERKETPVRVRLYIARPTPNAQRAERNLQVALARVDPGRAMFNLEVIDVFIHPHRATTDGVVVTPSLVGMGVAGRAWLVGDLSDIDEVTSFLMGLTRPSST